MSVASPALRQLSRAAGDGRTAAPVRHVHLGLGNFFRAHQAWYTENAPDRDGWGIAAFSGRSAGLAKSLGAQDGLYSLTTRSAAGDLTEVISSLAAAHTGGVRDRLLGYLRDPQVAVVTLTVTEAGYRRDANGRLDMLDPALVADLEALHRGGAVPLTTLAGRLTAGLEARRRAHAGPLTVVSCDNLPENGEVTARVVREFASLASPALGDWIESSSAS